MKRKKLSSILAAFALTICLAGLASAQEVTGSIVGSVRDNNGAAVSGATVTITDPSKDNQVVRTIVTNDDGSFSAPNIQISTYSVSVEASNFKKAVNTGIKVDVGQRRTVDVTLTAGKIDEVVTVTADAVAVDLSTPTVGTTISGDQVRELSINNRNFVQLVTLAPGVSSNLSDQVYVGTTNPEGQANTVPISVNGSRSSSNTFTVDGADITDRGSNLTIQTYPSVDSIGEFKVLRSLYPAESGRSGGGQVNVVTRSGTDTFHGSAFEFVRNEKFNANTYSLNRLSTNRDCASGVLQSDPNCIATGKARRPPFRYNNYGFTIGGPIYFLNFGEHDPDDGFFTKYRKTYFFFSEEQRKDRRFPTLTSQVPNAGLRNGVFSVPVCLSGTISGTTRTCTNILPAGTPLPSGAINPVSQQYLTNIFNKAPLPNTAPFGLTAAASGRADFQQEIIKIDSAITDKLSGYYRYQRDKIPTTDVNSLFSSGSGIPGVSTSSSDSPGRAHTLQLTYLLSPKLIVEGRYTYSYGAILSSTTGLLAKANSAINVPLPFASNDDRVPHLTVTGFNGLVAFGPYDNFSDKHDYSGNITWIAGNHIAKFGASFSKYRKNENALGGSNQGAFSAFNNTTAASPTQGLVCVNSASVAILCPAGQQTSEQSFANFLLGTNATFTQSRRDLTADFRQRNVEAYAQDEWRLRQGLTLYYGVRYSFFGSPWDRNGILSNFDPALYNAAAAPRVDGGGNRVAGTGNYCNGIVVNAQNYTTGPASFNCTPTASPFGKYVVDAGKKNFAPRVGLAWDPFGNATTVIRLGYGVYHEQTLVGTFEQNLGVNPPYQETITVSGVNISNPVPGSAPVVALASPPGAIRGVQTDYHSPYAQHWSLDVQHVFGKNTKVSVGYYGSKGTHLIGVVDLNNLRPGEALARTCAVGTSTTPSAPCQARDVVSSVPIPFTSAAGSLILDQIRPYRGWRGIALIQPRFNSNYHSLQVSAEHRFSGSSQVSLAYTWSKNLTDNQTDRSTAPMNYYDIGAEYGRAQLDRRHITTINYIYELPYFDKQSGLTGKLLGGWQASGIVTLQTGLPFTPTYAGFDPAGIGFLNASSPAGGRPFVFSNPNNGNQTYEEYFNFTAFQSSTPTTAPAVVGNGGRGIIEGPPTYRVDFTLTKNIRLTESMKLQLKGEAFNILNHTNFTTLAVAASTPHTVSATTGAVSGFGTVTGTRDPRTMQFGIKFLF